MSPRCRRSYCLAIRIGLPALCLSHSYIMLIQRSRIGSTFAYNDARLYEKFAFATKQGGTPVIVGSPQFICNPELLASKNVSRPVEMKGMQGPTHEYAFQNYFMKGKSNNGHPVQFMSKTVALLNDGTNDNKHIRSAVCSQPAHFICQSIHTGLITGVEHKTIEPLVHLMRILSTRTGIGIGLWIATTMWMPRILSTCLTARFPQLEILTGVCPFILIPFP